jgi:autotransporter translocation and assembly factor TamB
MGALAKKLLRVLLRAGLVLLALLGSATASLRLPVARRVAAVWLSDFVSREIRGALAIANIYRLSPAGIAARGVVLFDAEGRRVVEAERLVLRLDLTALMQKRVRFARARLDRATVHLYDEKDELPSLLTAFDAPTSTTTSPSSSGEPLQVQVSNIEISRVTVIGELLGLHDLRANELHARGSLRIGRDVHVKIDEAETLLVEPFGYVAQIDALTGTISTRSEEGIVLNAHVHRDSEQADARIKYAGRPGDPTGAQALQLEISAHEISAGTLRGMGFTWMPEVAVPLSGRVTLLGPTSDLVVQGALSSPAGQLELFAQIKPSERVAVTLRSDALELAKVFPDTPRVRVRGQLQIETTPHDAAPRMHLEVDPLLYGVIAVPGFKLDGIITQSGFRIDRIDARSRGGRISGSGRIERSGELELRMRASFADIANDENLRRFWPDAHAALQAELHVSSAKLGPGQFNFAGHIRLSNLQYALVSALRLDLDGSARGDPEQPRISLQVKGQEVRLGAYLLGDPILSLQGGPRSYAAEGQFNAAGRRTFNISARIVAEEHGFVVDADPIELMVGEGSWRGAMQGLRVVSDEVVELGLLRLASRSQRLEASGLWRVHGEDQLDVQLQDFDLAAVRALVGERFPLEQGHADTRIQLQGDIADPNLHVQGALRDGVAGSLSGISALYLVTYKAGAIEASGEVDLVNRGALQIDGTGRVDRSLENPLEALRYGSYDVNLVSQGLSIALLPAVQRIGIDGAATGNLRFKGTLENPELEGTLEVETLKLPDCTPLSLSAEAGYSDDEMTLRFSLADDEGPLLTASGQLQLAGTDLGSDPSHFVHTLMHGPWQLSGQTSKRRLDEMPRPVAKLLPYPALFASHFELQKADGVTQGAFDFDADWDEAFEASVCAKRTQPHVHGTLALLRGNSHLAFTVSAGKTQVADFAADLDTAIDDWMANGRIERPKLVRAGGRVTIDAMQRLPYLCEYGSGSFHAQLQLDGGLSEQPALVVSAETAFSPRTLSEDRRRRVAVRSCANDPIRARFELHADATSLSGSGKMEGCRGGASEVEGHMGVRWDRLLVLPSPRADEELKGLVRFDGAQLRPLLDRIPGVMNGDALAYGELDLSGTPAQLRVGGQLTIDDGALYLVGMGQQMSAITMRLTFLGDWVRLEHLQAQLGNGRLEASGGIGLKGLWPGRARVALRATRLPIKHEGVDTAWLSGSAVVDADITEAHTHAAVQLQQLEITLPDTTNRVLQQLETNEDVSVVTEKPEVRATPYPIELMITGKRKLTVRRNDFNAGIAAELAVSYRDPELSVGGYISFSSGEFEIFGKRFTINNGALRFDGSNDFNPDIFLLATQKQEVAGVSPVTVTVTGTLAEPVVTFTVDICPGESAALMYLVSGQCATDDPDLAQDSTDTQAAFTSGLVSGVLTLGAQRELSGLVPRFAVERTGNAQRVRAGFSSETIIPKFMRKLVRRVYVEGGVYTAGNGQGAAATETNAGTNTTPQFLIELYFPHNIVGSGRFAPENWGVDMLWEP